MNPRVDNTLLRGAGDAMRATITPAGFRAVILLALGLCAAPSHAQTPSQPPARMPPSWPQRAVHLIVPFGAGSATDVTARLFADRLAKRWGQPVVVENRPGADSIVAVGAFAASHDDHTLLYSPPGPITVNPALYARLPYDPARDLAPISLGSEVFVTIAVPASLKLTSLTELVARARAEPGKLNWVATPGVVYFRFAGFVKSAGLDMVQVPYKDFTQAINDLAEGRIDVTATSLAVVRPHVQAGKVTPLAVTSRERAPGWPDVPTASEAGFPALAFAAFGGFFGGRDMPADLRERIAADIRAAGSDPALAATLTAAGVAVRTSTPAEFAAAIEDERAKVAAIAQAVGVKPTQ
jgi:tripartite-type tricarboxylate transporter receptor subunit TctC